MGEYDTVIATALRLIQKKGRGIIIQREVVLETPLDPATPWRVANADPDEYPARACFLHYTTNRQDTDKVDQDEKMLLAAAGLTITLQKTDRIYDPERARTLAILEPKTIQPGSQIIYYDCRVREWLPTTSQQ